MRSPNVLLLLVLLAGSFFKSGAQENLSLQPGGFSEGTFHLRVNGTSGGTYRVEVSSNLVDWAELITLNAPSDLFDVSDAAITGFMEKFYRAQNVILSAGGLRAEQTNVFSGDGTTIVVGEVAPAGWKFTVDGSETGNETSGWIVASPADPAQAFYTAPIVSAPRDVLVCAEDRADASRKFCATVHIVPIAGTLVVQPAIATLGVGAQQQFKAFVDVNGVGLLPLNRALWKVNGTFGGTAEFGAIGLAGIYQAPKQLPAKLPASIEVGFSFGIDAPVLAKAQLTLAALKLDPEKIVFTESGQQKQLTATLLKSDGTSVVQPAGAVTFSSSAESLATVAPSGQVTAGTNVGRGFIAGLHNTFPVQDYALVEGRKQARIYLLDVAPRSGDRILPRRFGFTPVQTVDEVEVTAPGALFNLKPDVYFYRGAFSLFSDSVSGIGNTFVRIDGDGTKILSYDPDGAIPQPSALVATVDRKTGFTIIGDTPGSGMVRFTYDDGYVRHSSTSIVTYTRLKLNATMTPEVSKSSSEAYINEWLSFHVEVANPRTDSTFIGNTPIRIRRADGGRFFIASRLSKPEGFTQLPYPLQVNETADALFEIPGGEKGFDPDFGRLDFWISARDAGNTTFIVSVPNDSGIPPVEFPIRLVKPRLRIAKGQSPPLVRGLPGYGAIPGSSVVQHSFVDLEQFEGPKLSEFSAVPNIVDSLKDQDPLIWTVERPDGSREVIPNFAGISDANSFSRNFHQVGHYTITLGYQNRSELSTEPLEVNVVSAATDFPEVAAAAKGQVLDSDGQVVSLENQLAGLQILSPTLDTPWIDGTPITITARAFNGLGQPKVIGKKIRRITRNTGQATFEQVSYQIGGFWAAYVSGPSQFTPFDVRRIFPAYPDANGILTVQFTPQNNASGNSRDLVIALVPDIFTLEGEQFTPAVSLPEEIHEIKDGVVVRDDQIPLGIASFTTPSDRALLDQAILFGGSGAVLVPRFLPVATQRLREAVQAGRLPQDADLITFRMRGRAAFQSSLDAGLPVIDFGGRAEIVSAKREANEVVYTARTDLQAFEAAPALYTPFTPVVTLGNGTKINVDAEFIAYRVETNTVDFNLPLNAAYSYQSLRSSGALFWDRHEDAMLFLRIATPVATVPYRALELELRPSIQACWDRNTNGLADANEDLDGDGLFTEADATNAVPFRGALADQPLVGFSRRANPATGEPEIREFRKRMVGSSPEFYIFGNTTDKRWLDRTRMTLSDPGMPDGIPDFASPSTNAETLLLTVDGGNLADSFSFTAYNLMADVQQDLPEPNLNFASLSNNIEKIYEAYGTFRSDSTLQDAGADPRSRNAISVYVDHEARSTDFHADEPNVLENLYPFKFYAGVLDQFYQRGVRGAGAPEIYRLGQDRRVHEFDSRDAGAGPTGQRRRYFGLELDGPLFDAISLNVVVDRPLWSFLPGVMEAYNLYLLEQNVLTNRLDEKPNSPALLGIPVVQEVLGDRVNLTSQDLIRSLGGSSGGFADLTRSAPGSFMVESKTPGADLPGLHAGFLVDGRVDQLFDPVTGLGVDDIRTVLLKRDPATSRVLTPVEPVLSFGSNEDFKEPIKTGLKMISNYAIHTDPPGVAPANPDLFQFRAWVALREIPSARTNDSLLTVTTQSDGHEKVLKLLVDAVVDVTVDVTAAAVLGVLTEGAYFSCGGVNLGQTALNAFINFSIGLTDADVIPGGRNFKTPLTFLNKTVNLGFGFSDLKPLVYIPIPGVTIPGLRKYEFSTPKLKEFSFQERLLTPDYKIYSVPSYAVVPFCSILTAPVSKFKDLIKSTYSAELFNGLGTANAFGMQALSICIPNEAQVTNGLYAATFMISKELEIQPKEPDSRQLNELPFERVFGSYPFADEMSDESLIRRAQDRAANAGTAQTRADAVVILDHLLTNSVLRVPRTTLYQPYKLRAASLPAIVAAVGPGQPLQGGNPFGDFVLTPGRTVIPVASVGVAMAGRSNENAGSRARVTSPGHEMVLIGAVIRRPPQFSFPFKGSD